MRGTRVFSNRSMITSSGYIARRIAAKYSPEQIRRILGEANLPKHRYETALATIARETPGIARELGIYPVG